jgi:hypothetical protein
MGASRSWIERRARHKRLLDHETLAMGRRSIHAAGLRPSPCAAARPDELRVSATPRPVHCEARLFQRIVKWI